MGKHERTNTDLKKTKNKANKAEREKKANWMSKGKIR